MSRRKANKTGRGSNALSPFIAIERYIMDSQAWRSLKPGTRATYLEICFAYDGSNNGRLRIGSRWLGDRLGVDKSTAARAIKELEATGFLETVKFGAFNYKVRHVAEYRLAAFKCDVTGALPTKNFMRWKPQIQNSVVPMPLNGGASATDTLKTTANSPLRLHLRHREARNGIVDGGTGATLLYSTKPDGEVRTSNITTLNASSLNTERAAIASKPRARDQPQTSLESKLTPHLR